MLSAASKIYGGMAKSQSRKASHCSTTSAASCHSSRHFLGDINLVSINDNTKNVGKQWKNRKVASRPLFSDCLDNNVEERGTQNEAAKALAAYDLTSPPRSKASACGLLVRHSPQTPHTCCGVSKHVWTAARYSDNYSIFPTFQGNSRSLVPDLLGHFTVSCTTVMS